MASKMILGINEFDNNDVLIIVDVQKSFSKYFTENYLKELKKYSKKFKSVYLIWDNHIDGKNVDKDFLYDENPNIPIHDDLYTFNNQKDIIEKRYNYDVTIDYYKVILNDKDYKTIKQKEINDELTKGDIFYTNKGTAVVFIDNNHNWTHIPKKLINIFNNLNNKKVTIVGGADNECLEDIIVAAKSMGLIVFKNIKYVYSATNCPIK